MDILIVEDEQPAARRLQKLLEASGFEVNLIAPPLASVAEAVAVLSNEQVDLIFLDIQLSDGLSFEIFDHFEQNVLPVIFTTAYDEYLLDAFQLNSIAYLLKPLSLKALKDALGKFTRLNSHYSLKPHTVQKAFPLEKPTYKSRFLAKKANRFTCIPVHEVAYLYAEDKLTYLQDFSGERHLLNQNLSQVGPQLNPDYFFQLNRQTIASVEAIAEVHPFFQGKLKISLQPNGRTETVSRLKAGNFRKWLDA